MMYITLRQLPSPYIYFSGVRCKDSSVVRGRAGHTFLCRSIMLFWTGDYPGQALVSGTHSKTCHWCCKKSSAAPEVSRRVWNDFRQCLPSNHIMRRTSALLGPAESRPPPPPREHSVFVQSAKENERHEALLRAPDARSNGVYKKDLPYKSTGVKEVSPLTYLPLFDIVWDILPDMMHIVPGIWERHIFPLLAGKRKLPSAVKARKKNTERENANLMHAHTSCCAQIAEWTLSKDTIADVDGRSRALAGEPSWVRSNLEIFTHASTLTSHDWIQLVQSAGHYILAGIFPDRAQQRKEKALQALVAACNAVLTMTSDRDSDSRDQVDRVKVQVVEALCLCESVLPVTELPVMLHILLHVPDCVYRWNAVRNFWSFFGERAMGYIIRFIKNRDLAAENIMTTNCRMRLILDCPPGAVTHLLAKLAAAGTHVCVSSRQLTSV